MHPDFEQIFAATGALGASMDGYRVRPQQAQMARLAYQAMQENTCLIAEAGTGTGKSFAYLVPALLSGGKVIISTGTKTLQDQLFERDLPAVRNALKLPATLALLKGRANYVCHYHLRRAREQGRFQHRDELRHLQIIERFANTSASGDRSALADVPEDASVWSHVTSTRDNCLGQECEFHDKCFVMRARKAAQSAEIVVVNHHLFFADVMLRDEGVSELLPDSNVVIFDEAHQLPETANIFFGSMSSTTQWLELARDSRAAMLTHAADAKEIEQATEALEKAARDLRLVFGPLPQRYTRQQMLGDSRFAPALKLVQSTMATLAAFLQMHAERAIEIGRCHERALDAQQRLAAWDAGDATAEVAWLEVMTHALQLHITPLSIAEEFKKQIDGHARAWIFTSATLTIGGDFGHFQSQLGLEAADTDRWESPFDYARNSLLYVPKHLPEPSSADYTSRLVDAAVPVIEASRGRAFFLFTSHRALKQASELLAGRTRYPLLIQGSLPRAQLLERFRAAGDAVLLATASFWEGVDVRGPALSCVIIDKLPFAAPDDPVLRARAVAMEEAGRNPFMEYQIPAAVIALKQGAGRLIRDIDDRGVLMIGDPRLYSKSYGRVFLASLPPMPRTRELDEVQRFFADPGAHGKNIAPMATREKEMG